MTPYGRSVSRKRSTRSNSPDTSTITCWAPASTTRPPKRSTSATARSRCGPTTASFASASSRLSRGASVRSSTEITSISRSSCFWTWSTSAWPASTVSVIRDRPWASVGPTDRPWMLNPRRRTIPATRVRTPGWSSTTAERILSRDGSLTTLSLPPAGGGLGWGASAIFVLGVLIRQLREVVEPLAQGHDGIDVGVGIDAEVDQHRPGRPLREVERGPHVLHALHAQAGQPVRVGQLDEVRHLAQVDLGADPAVEVVLELAHHTQREV